MSFKRYPLARQIKILLPVSLLFITTSAIAERPRPNLPDAANGQAAIAVLGPRLPAVANANGFSALELRGLLSEDQNLWVDDTDSLFYVEPAVDPEASDPEASDGAPESSAPAQDNYAPSQAFLLNSKPGSARTIFLDFDGHLVDGTAWNSSLGNNFQAPPFDLDGAPNTFSDSERNRIIGIWKRVAEDFAPFDVNVTTQDPGQAALVRSSSSDNVYGTRALISRSNAACSGCGGVAYVGTFDSTNNAYYQPAWVFFNALGNGNEKYVAEAISHEVGHNGGLSHDGNSSVTYYAGHGSGATGWAPIMGNGYYKSLTQFSKGEYNDANNTQDDFSVFAANGIAKRTDDHGDTLASATSVNQGTTFSVSGIIEDRNDYDFVKIFAGAGDVTVTVDEHTHGANLDIELTAYDASGQVLGQSNPATLLDSGLVFSAVQEGNYYLRVRGVGYGTPSTGYSDYASLGYFKINGTFNQTSGNQPPIARAEGTPLTGTAPLEVLFSSSNSSDPDGSIVGYHWDFGDGTSSTVVNPSHTYTSEGTFTATLTVTDSDGATDNASVQINVDPVDTSVSAPGNLTASVSGLSVFLTWSNTTNNHTGLRIHRGIESGKGKNKSVSWSLIATLGASSTSYNDSNLAEGTYVYRVEAFNQTDAAFSSNLKVNVGGGGKGGKGGGGKGGKNR